MLEVKNTVVTNLGRSLNAAGNAFSIGEIDSRWTEIDSIHENFFSSINEDERLKNNIKPYQRSLGRNAEDHQSHDHYLCGIGVTFDIKYPLYWSPEFQRYHFSEIVSSQSTMHCLTNAGKREDFAKLFNKYVDGYIISIVKNMIDDYNHTVDELKEIKKEFNECEDWEKPGCEMLVKSKQNEVYEKFMKIRSNLPSGYEMWMTVETNYLELKTILKQRTNHKLKEDWGAFCDWIHTLPLFDYLTQKGE
ncbi:MAG: hypothetical protein MJZ11_08580 [Lachnospiraceae bacterium]|nr:hypothetical protein [Lachnospiraceae bacterium]